MRMMNIIGWFFFQSNFLHSSVHSFLRLWDDLNSWVFVGLAFHVISDLICLFVIIFEINSVVNIFLFQVSGAGDCRYYCYDADDLV